MHKAFFALTALLFLSSFPVFASGSSRNLPDSIYVGGQKSGHVQGLAYDAKNRCMYMSFTTRFLKVDLDGNLIGSIENLQGHLGAMTLSPVDGRVYASYECKDDEIGAGISRSQGTVAYTREQASFRIAVIDVEKLDSVGMEASGLIRTFCVVPAGEDYRSGKYGCSGIDGVTFVPRAGCRAGRKAKWQLCVAYGIYGDVNRDDNDCQILLTYDIPGFEKCLTPYGDPRQDGPAEPDGRYYIYTGNTSYGVQNLAYDAATGKIFMAVYRGKKPRFANYSLFATDWNTATLATSYDDAVSGGPLEGWHFKWGSTGLFPVGNGLWYISENGYDKVSRTQSCNARLYRFDLSSPTPPFRPE